MMHSECAKYEGIKTLYPEHSIISLALAGTGHLVYFWIVLAALVGGAVVYLRRLSDYYY